MLSNLGMKGMCGSGHGVGPGELQGLRGSTEGPFPWAGEAQSAQGLWLPDTNEGVRMTASLVSFFLLT